MTRVARNPKTLSGNNLERSKAQGTVAEAGHGAGVVAHEEERDAPGLQVQQQVEQMPGQGGIQGRKRFVQHQQLGPGHERPGQGETLRQATRPLAGALGQGSLGKLHSRCHGRAGLAPLLRITLAMDDQGFLQDLPSVQVRGQRRQRILENRLEDSAPRSPLGFGQGRPGLTVEANLALGSFQQAQNRPGQCRLACATRTHHAPGFTLLDLKGQVPQRPAITSLNTEIPDFQDRHHVNG